LVTLSTKDIGVRRKGNPGSTGITLSDNGAFHSESTIPPLVQQWLIRHKAAPAAEKNQLAPPATAAAHAAPPPDEIDDDIREAASEWMSSNIINIDGVFPCVDPYQVVPQYVHDWMDHIRAQIEIMKQENQLAAQAAATDDEIDEAVHAWISSHRITITDGVIQFLDPDQMVPKFVQDRTDYNLAQIASLQEASHKAKRIHQQLPAKPKSPAANTEERHPSGATETVPTNDPPAAEEMEANPSETAENATIEIDAQGDTVEGPIIIDESTSNSDNDSAHEVDKST